MHLHDGNGSGSGHTRIYQWDSTNSVWNQLGSDIDGEAAYDYSGRSVSLSSDGSIVAIGARNNDGNGSDSAIREFISGIQQTLFGINSVVISMEKLLMITAAEAFPCLLMEAL